METHEEKVKRLVRVRDEAMRALDETLAAARRACDEVAVELNLKPAAWGEAHVEEIPANRKGAPN